MTLDGDFPEKFFAVESVAERRTLGARLGVVVGGSLSEGLIVRADEPLLVQHLAEGVPVGAYVAVEGNTDRTFFGMITDVELDYVNPQARSLNVTSEFQRAVYSARRSTAYFTSSSCLCWRVVCRSPCARCRCTTLLCAGRRPKRCVRS